MYIVYILYIRTYEDKFIFDVWYNTANSLSLSLNDGMES